MTRHPAGAISIQTVRQQHGVVMALHHAQHVLVHFLGCHKPGLVIARATCSALFLDPANTQTRTLAQGVEAQAHVLAQTATTVVQNPAGFLADIAVQKLAERAFTDEADAC